MFEPFLMTLERKVHHAQISQSLHWPSVSCSHAGRGQCKSGNGAEEDDSGGAKGGTEGRHLTAVLQNLPPDGLAVAAETLARAVVSRKETLHDYLEHRVSRVYPSHWPKSTTKRSGAEAQAIALFCIRTADKFPLWLEHSRPFLSRFPDIYLVLKEFVKSGLCTDYPQQSLDLLDRIVPDDPYISTELADCLLQISGKLPRTKKLKKVSSPV